LKEVYNQYAISPAETGIIRKMQPKNAMTETLNQMMDVVLNVLLKRATAVEKIRLAVQKYAETK